MIELIYYASGRNEWLEKQLGECAQVGISSGEDRKSFLTALAASISKSDVCIAVGPVTTLSKTLAKGLGLPLETVDWSQFGISGDAEAALPAGALPLTVEGSVYGMILESGQQCIIALDNDESAVEHLFNTYVQPYIQAVFQPEAETEPEAVAQAAEAERISEPEPEPERISEPEPISQHDYAAQPDIKQADGEYDIFADMSADDIDFLMDQPPRRRWVPVVCVILAVLIIAAGCYWFVIPYFAGSTNYYSSLMAEYGDVGDTELLPEDFSTTHLTRFGALYLQNSDIIGVVKVNGIGINLPIVSAASKEEGFYTNHRYDGRFDFDGTPYISEKYDESTSLPNMVVYGGELFAKLEQLTDPSTAENINSIKTDSILYGEDEWAIFSAFVCDSLDSEFIDNFSDMNVENRIKAVKKALSLSAVDFGFAPEDFDNVGLGTNFVTLIGETSDNNYVVVMARMTSNSVIEIVEGEEDAENATSESADTNSDTVSQGTASSN